MERTIEQPTCKTCPYFDGYTGVEGDGFCRVNPPKRFDVSDEYGYWPEVFVDDWCSQHPDMTTEVVNYLLKERRKVA